MIGLDTNVLARYYIEHQPDVEATRQRVKAQHLIDSGVPMTVCKTVLLELEWLLRNYYGFPHIDTIAIFRHLQSLTHIEIEDRDALEMALSNCESGLEFADAFHHGSYRKCDAMASFGDRRFARRVKRLGLSPPVIIPK